jgi:Protein of unknown function (DUF2855)
MVLEVRPDALAETQLTAESLEPADGQALLRVLRFGCTSNSVTYALLGDRLGFTRFFPASVGWARVPAWGIAEVVATRTDTVREGERFFGFCPMAAEMLLTPRPAPFGVVDVADHRASLMPAYNAYRRPDADGQDEQILLRPLFLLAFLLDEDLVARGAGAVLLSSASSKTALAIAFLVASRGSHVIGLTSPRNEQFVRDVGVYDEVVAYDAIDALPRRSVAFIDVAGEERVRERVHEHFRDDLIFSGIVGATHLDTSAFAAPPALDFGPQPEPVSANGLLRERERATGQDRLDADIAQVGPLRRLVRRLARGPPRGRPRRRPRRVPRRPRRPRAAKRGTRREHASFALSREVPERDGDEWAIQDSNLGPLPYQRKSGALRDPKCRIAKPNPGAFQVAICHRMFRQSSAAWVPLGQFEGLASALEVGCARWEDRGNSMASANVRVVPYVMRQVGHADSSMTPSRPTRR